MSVRNHKKTDNQQIDEQWVRCFVIQPFGQKKHPKTGEVTDNDKVFVELSKLQNIRPTFPIKVDRADIGNINEQDLHEHVMARLMNSDFCIADLTGQNPNVLYEAGFAKGIGLRIILLCQQIDDIPTDLKKYIYVCYDKNRLEDLSTLITPHLELIQHDVFNRRGQRTWQVKYFSTRSEADIRQLILQAQERIDILQTNLITIATDYLQQILESMRKKPQLKLRILTLNPQSIFVNYRGAQVGFGENIALYREELEGNLKSLHFALREFGDRVNIKVYDDFPNQIVFFFDNKILACVVSATGRSRDNCAFLLDTDFPGTQKSFTTHFDYLWDKKSVKYHLPL